jgi:hypothetical protein
MLAAGAAIWLRLRSLESIDSFRMPHRGRQLTLDDPGSFATLVLIATVTKLTSSIDDIVWLLPFVSSSDRSTNIRNGTIYLFMMEVVVGLASSIAFGGGVALQSVLDEAAYWNAERVLGVASGVCLLLYSAFLFHVFLQGDDNPEDETETVVGSDQKQPETLSSLEGALSKSATAEDEPENTTEKGSAVKKPEGNLFVICFLGSLDDMSVQAALLLGGTFHPLELALGVLLGSAIVVCFCMFASLFERAVQLVQRLPLFGIILAFGTFSLVSALL